MSFQRFLLLVTGEEKTTSWSVCCLTKTKNPSSICCVVRRSTPAWHLASICRFSIYTHLRSAVLALYRPSRPCLRRCTGQNALFLVYNARLKKKENTQNTTATTATTTAWRTEGRPLFASSAASSARCYLSPGFASVVQRESSSRHAGSDSQFGGWR